MAVNRVDADFSGVRPSAVLVLLADDADGNAGVLLTRRSTELRNHAGQISFPGGRIDPGETEIEAALREAHEEVGLDPAAVEVVGELDHLATVVSRSHIVPVVGRVAAQLALAPASPEVERVLWVPLAEFVRADTFRAERWTVPWECRGAGALLLRARRRDRVGRHGAHPRRPAQPAALGTDASVLQQLPRLGDVALLASPATRSRSAAPGGRRARSA